MLSICVKYWSIEFLKKAGILLSCSPLGNFQKTKTYMLESIFNKVRRYCFSKYKLHRRRFLSKYSEILTLAFRKVFGAFVPVLHEANPIAAVFLSYLLEALTFIPWSFDLHVRKNYSCYYNYYGTFFVFLVIQYTDMSVKPYQFEPLKKKKCSGNVEEDCGDKTET